MIDNIRPTLLLDKETCLRNIERMAQKAQQYKLRFRPHFKTHQSAQIGEWFKRYSVEAITVSSVQMAEYFNTNGWNDITIAFPLNILEMESVNRLADSCKLNVLLENRDAATVLAQKISHRIGVFIKIDTGYNRTGIPASRTRLIDAILDEISKNKLIEFQGFLSHAGHTYHTRTTNEIFNIHFDALLKLKSLKTHYKKTYPGIEVSIGDTPSASLCGNFNGVDEIRPGNFVFYDLMQHHLGVCSIDDIAVRMVCPVVAKHRSRNEIVIYGGAIHFSKETVLNIDGKPSFGKVVLCNGDKKNVLDNKNYLCKLSQEHGIIKVTPSNFRKINVGDLIEIIPVHSCLTTNLMGHLITTEGELIRTIPRY